MNTSRHLVRSSRRGRTGALLVLIIALGACEFDRVQPRAGDAGTARTENPARGVASARSVTTEGVEADRMLGPATLAEVSKQFPFLPAAQLEDGRLLVSLDGDAVGALEAGSTFPFQLPGLEQRQAFVDSVEEYEGMRRVRGRLLGGEDRTGERFSMTLSSDRSYVAGRLELSGRELSLEVRNGSGWIADAMTSALLDDAIPSR